MPGCGGVPAHTLANTVKYFNTGTRHGAANPPSAGKASWHRLAEVQSQRPITTTTFTKLN